MATNLDLLSTFRQQQQQAFNPLGAALQPKASEYPSAGSGQPLIMKKTAIAAQKKKPAATPAPTEKPTDSSSWLPFQGTWFADLMSSGRQAQRQHETGIRSLSDTQIEAATREMRKANPELTDDQIAEGIAQIDNQLYAEKKQKESDIQQKKAQKAKQQEFADLHPDEGVLEQTAKAPLRAVGRFGEQAKENLKNLGLSSASFITRSVNDLNKLVGSKDYDPELEQDIQETTGSTGYFGDIARSTQASTGLMSQYYAPGVSLGFAAAEETPGLRMVPQTLNKAMDIGAEGISALTGLEKGTASSLLGTGVNTLMVKGGIKSQGTMGDIASRAKTAFTEAPTATSGLKLATKSVASDLGTTAGKTVVDIAKTPIEIAKKIPGVEKGALALKNKTAEFIAPNFNKIGKTAFETIQRATGFTPKQFALKEGIQDSSGANDAKIKYIDQKLEAVKNFGETEVTGVERRLATAIRDNLQSTLDKFTEGLTPEEAQAAHSEQMKVIGAMDKIINSTTVPYTSLEALKSLYDYYNPDGLRWENGKPVSSAANEAAAAQRQVLQQKVEKAGIDNKVDIAKMNKNIQASHALEEGLSRLEGNAERSNAITFSDAQIATLAAIIDGGASALGSLLFKKGILENAGLRFKIASKLYNPDVTQSSLTPRPSNPPISRVGRILGNMSDSAAEAPQQMTPAQPGSLVPRQDVWKAGQQTVEGLKMKQPAIPGAQQPAGLLPYPKVPEGTTLPLQDYAAIEPAAKEVQGLRLKQEAAKQEGLQMKQKMAEPIQGEQMALNTEPVDIKSVAETIKKEGGITLDKEGKPIGGQPYIAVSIYPERSAIVDANMSDVKLEKAVADFYDKNWDLIKQSGHTFGAWYDKDSGKIYLDVSTAIPKTKMEQALALAKKYNQKAVFDLEDFNEIDTGGTGEALKKAIPESQRMKEILGLME